MSFRQAGGGSDLPTLLNDFNAVVSELNTQEVTKIFKDDWTRRVLLGKGPLGHGLFVSPEGVDVFEATADQLIFNSGQNVFKIAQTDEVKIDATAASAGVALTATVTHGLGYAPIPLVFIVINNGYSQLPTPGGMSVAGGAIVMSSWCSCSTNETELTIEFYPATSGNLGVKTFKWYLLQERANS